VPPEIWNHRTATSNHSGTEPSEELKRELDANVRDDEAHQDERMAADRFIVDRRKTKFDSLPQK
jgi:hypothetical protein